MYYIKNVCVLCLQNNAKLQNVRNKDVDNVTMLHKLEYTIMSLDNDFHDTSLNICEQCHSNLNNLYAFKQQSVRNLNFLKAYTHQLSTMSPNFKHFSGIWDGNRAKELFFDKFEQSRVGYCDDTIKNENVPLHNESNENEDTCESDIQNNIKIEDLSENDMDQNQVEEHNTTMKNEDDVDVDYELFEKQISNNDIKHEAENKLGTENCTETLSAPSYIENFPKLRPFKCRFCTKAFNRTTDLVRHIRTHTGEKPFKCHICLKAFSQKSNLRCHLESHTGQPFTCRVCMKAFTQEGYLRRHLKTHSEEEKLFKCNYCTKGFRDKADLLKHIRIHTGEKPFQCQICMKAFNLKTTLNCHLRTHTGEKPYKCHICAKAFTDQSNLRCHVRTHSNEKSFKCPKCMKTFKQQSNLIRHNKAFHKSENSLIT